MKQWQRSGPTETEVCALCVDRRLNLQRLQAINTTTTTAVATVTVAKGRIGAADLHPSTGGSAVRTPLVAKLQAASVPIALAAAPWDRQTDGLHYSKMPA